VNAQARRKQLPHPINVVDCRHVHIVSGCNKRRVHRQLPPVVFLPPLNDAFVGVVAVAHEMAYPRIKPRDSQQIALFIQRINPVTLLLHPSFNSSVIGLPDLIASMRAGIPLLALQVPAAPCPSSRTAFNVLELMNRLSM